MKSSELASLAGVTVRALRHYHQVGVLPEPPRGLNGYRDYTVHDLIRLLRIKRLAALGVSLEAMTGVLEADAGANDALLDQLYAAIDAEVGRLQAQQRLIQLVRAQRGALDLPPELGRFITLFSGPERSASAAQLDQQQAVLVAHLFDGDGLAEVAGLYDLLAQPEYASQAIELTLQFDELTGDPNGAAPAVLAERMLELLTPLVRLLSFDGTGMRVDESRATELMLEFQNTTMNPAQRATLELVTAALAATQA